MAPGLEAMSRTDGAWYDVASNRSRVGKDGKLVLRFKDFPASDQEFYNLRDLDTLFRLCSRPVEDFQCRELYQGQPVCALAKFPETGDQRWMDAEVVEICSVDHTGEEECSCQFKVKWVGVQRLAAHEIEELRIQESCWVGIDRICNLESASHLDHPVILKWKRAMIYSANVEDGPVLPPSTSKDTKSDGLIPNKSFSSLADQKAMTEEAFAFPRDQEDFKTGNGLLGDHPNHPAIRVEAYSDDSPSTSSSQSPEKQYLQPFSSFANGSDECQETACTRKRTVASIDTDNSEESECRGHKKRMLDYVPWRETDPLDSNNSVYRQPSSDKVSTPTDMVAWRVGKLFGVGTESISISNTETFTDLPSAPCDLEDDTSEKISFLTELWKEGYPGSLEDENVQEDLKCPKEDIPSVTDEGTADLPLFPHVPTRPRSNTVRRNRFKRCSIDDRQHLNQFFIGSQPCMSSKELVID